MVQPTPPAELIAEVLSHHRSPRVVYDDYSEQTKTLAACCLVSKQFLAHARAALYHCVDLAVPQQSERSDPTATEPAKSLARRSRKLYKTVTETPAIGALVQLLGILHSSARTTALLIDALRIACPKLTKVEFAGSTWPGTGELDQVLHRFGSSLEALGAPERHWDEEGIKLLSNLTGLTDLWLEASSVVKAVTPPSFELERFTVREEGSAELLSCMTHHSHHSLKTLSLPSLHEGGAWDLSPFKALFSLELELPGGTNLKLDKAYTEMMQTIRSCSSPPQHLRLWTRDPAEQLDPVDDYMDILHQLPATLLSLDVGDIPLSTYYLERALCRDKVLPSLRRIVLGDSQWDDVTETQGPCWAYDTRSSFDMEIIEEACEERRISLKWEEQESRFVDGRPAWRALHPDWS